MPKDLGTWGFILSLVAIVLMYPVGVLINITSPKLYNWYAGRSTDKAAERVTALTEKLHHLKQIDAGHPAYVSILTACMVIGLQVGATAHLLLGALFLDKTIKDGAGPFLVLDSMNIVFMAAVFFRLRQVRNRYSKRYRARIAEQLVDAEYRLRQAYIRLDKVKPPPIAPPPIQS